MPAKAKSAANAKSAFPALQPVSELSILVAKIDYHTKEIAKASAELMARTHAARPRPDYDAMLEEFRRKIRGVRRPSNDKH